MHLHLSPSLHDAGPTSVLDIGCGTGVWALAMAETYSLAHIIAIDLTPPAQEPPSNVTFLKADAEQDWVFAPQRHFDLIHGRMLASGIHDWPELLSRCWGNLKPGGWLELLDVCHPFRAEDSAADDPTSSSLIRWGYQAEKCWAVSGLDYRATTRHLERLRELGFGEIEERSLKWPLGEWADSERERRIGVLMLQNFCTFLDKAGVAILRQDQAVDEQEAQQLVEDAKRDLTANCCTKRFYLNVYGSSSGLRFRRTLTNFLVEYILRASRVIRSFVADMLCEGRQTRQQNYGTI
ncbi:MAG: hypothetical protein Q9190_000461 [Brigantiaea leucoxantha]